MGYSEEDLKESYGFLLFDDVNKVKTRNTGTPEKIQVLTNVQISLISIFVFV